MLHAIQDNDLLTVSSDQKLLNNTFSSQVATSEQRYHLMNFRQIGQLRIDSYIKYTFVTTSSTDLRLQLKTFPDQNKPSSRKLNNAERDKNKVTLCLKKRLQAVTQGDTHLDG